MSTLAISHADGPELPESFYLRLCNFYGGQPKEVVSPIWRGIYDKFYGELLTALTNRDPVALARNLNSLYDGMALFGMDWGNKLTDDVHFDRWMRSLENLGRRLGVLCQFNPEQPMKQSFDAATIYRDVCGRLKIKLQYPGCARMPGVQIGTGFVPAKLIESANLFGLFQLLQAKGPVLEIGSGQAFMGYICAQCDIKYHSLDLPIGSVIGAFTCAKGIGDNAVWLEGEPENGKAKVHFHGTVRPDGIAFGLVLNQDSLPEIPERQALDLIKFIADGALASGGAFISTNQESKMAGQNRVHEMVRTVAPQLHLCQRSPSWQRPGYVDEIWLKNHV